MGAGSSKPAVGRLALRRRRNDGAKPNNQTIAPTPPAVAAAAALPPPPPPPIEEDPDPALAYARTCAALERVLDEGVRRGRGRGHLSRAQHRRYSAAAAAAAAAEARRRDDDGPPPPVPPEAAAVARAALGLPPAPADAWAAAAGADQDLPQRSYWCGPPIPGCEDARLEAMDAYGLLADAAMPDEDEDEDEHEDGDGGRDRRDKGGRHGGGGAGGKDPTRAGRKKPDDPAVRPAIQSALDLVRGVFGCDEALVALFGDRRVYIRDTSGAFARGDFPWRWSFCWWTLAPPQPTALVVRDVRTDARFSANSVARKAGVAFYVGLPLIAPGSGHRLGVLCFASRAPRPDFDAASVSVASNLAEMVARELAREAQQAVARRVSAAARLRLRDMQAASAPVLLVERVPAAGEGEGGGEEGGGDGGAAAAARGIGGGRWIVRHANGAWIDLVARARRAQRLLSAPAGEVDGDGAAAAGGRGGGGGGDDDPFGGALAADLWRDVFEPPASLAPAAEDGDGPGAAPTPAGPDAARPSICRDSATSLPQVRGGGYGGGSGVGVARAKALIVEGLPPAPPQRPEQPEQQEQQDRLFALQAPFSVHGARMRRPPFRPGGASAAAPPGSAAAPVARATLRFVPAAAPGALGPPAGGIFTAAPACLPDAPPDAAQRRRLASLWFVDVEPEPLLAVLPSGGAPAADRQESDAVAPAFAAALAAARAHRAPLLQPSSCCAAAAAPSLRSPASAAPSSSACAALLPPSLDGLQLGPPLACGSYGRVFRGRFRGARVAVKVLDPEDALCRDAATGAALEATLGERLRHPNVVQTLAWGVVEAGSAAALPPRPRVWTRRRAPRASAAGAGSGGGVGVGGIGGGGGGVGGASAAALAASRPSTDSARPASGAVLSAASEGRRDRRSSAGSGAAAASNPFAEAARLQPFRHGQTLGGEGDEDEEEEDEEEDASSGGGGGHDQGSGCGGSGGGGGGGADGARFPPSSSAVSSRRSSALAAAAAPPSSSASGSPPNTAPCSAPPSRPQTWLVLEYCDGGSLQEAVDSGWLRTGRDPREGAPHMPAILATAREVASACAHLHAGGVVHGDLSAYNVLLASGGGGGRAGGAAMLGDRGWTAKVADFGLSRFAGGGVAGRPLQTRTYGTVTHQAPEVLSRGELAPPADVYAFGVLLWQMWTGARPWAGMAHAQVVRAVAAEGRALAWPDDAPQGLAALGEACLSADPAERPTFADVLEVLDPLLGVLEAAAAAAAAAAAGGATGAAAASGGATGASAAAVPVAP